MCLACKERRVEIKKVRLCKRCNQRIRGHTYPRQKSLMFTNYGPDQMRQVIEKSEFDKLI